MISNGRVFVPTEALRRFYNVPVEWDGATKEVKIKGASGWGTMKVEGRPALARRASALGASVGQARTGGVG